MMRLRLDVQFDIGNPFSLKKLLGIHDYVWEGEDDDDPDEV
jgi:hypothetical protein